MTPSPELSAEPAGERVPADLVEAGVFPTSAAGFDHGLVVLAMGHAYWLVPSDGGFRLLVEQSAFASVREQLACFERESRGWPPRPILENQPARKTERESKSPKACLAGLISFLSWKGDTRKG